MNHHEYPRKGTAIPTVRLFALASANFASLRQNLPAMHFAKFPAPLNWRVNVSIGIANDAAEGK
jgi:hypothetical protein